MINDITKLFDINVIKWTRIDFFFWQKSVLFLNVVSF